MPKYFNPVYTISPRIVQSLIRIEAARQKITLLPIESSIFSSLCHTAKLQATHYSTLLASKQLTFDKIKEIIEFGEDPEPSYVKGYYKALNQLEHFAHHPVTQSTIQTIHSLALDTTTLNSYRDAQSVLKDANNIVYMPPEAYDVPDLMYALVEWITHHKDLPCPIIAGIVHYQIITIRPYYEANGRISRLLTTLILKKGGYDIKGLCYLEQYHAQELNLYHQALKVGPSQNYYFGRAESDITYWLEYFMEGMAITSESILAQMIRLNTKTSHKSHSSLLRVLSKKQRTVLGLFKDSITLTAKDIGDLFGSAPRTNTLLCKKWVDDGFLEVVDYSNKARKYKLSSIYENLVSKEA